MVIHSFLEHGTDTVPLDSTRANCGQGDSLLVVPLSSTKLSTSFTSPSLTTTCHSQQVRRKRFERYTTTQAHWMVYDLATSCGKPACPPTVSPYPAERAVVIKAFELLSRIIVAPLIKAKKSKFLIEHFLNPFSPHLEVANSKFTFIFPLASSTTHPKTAAVLSKQVPDIPLKTLSYVKKKIVTSIWLTVYVFRFNPF